MDGSFVPFCFKYTDFRNLCNEKYKRKTIEGVEEGAYPQSCAMRMTAPSAEGAKGDFASAEAGFRACGHDQRTEPVWRLCARPLEIFAPCGGDSLKVAAALSAAVTTIYLQEIASNLQAEPSLKSPRPPNASRSSGERSLGGEALLSEKRPLPPESSPKFVSLLAKTGK